METRSQAKKRKANPEMPTGPDDNINLQGNGEILYIREEKIPDSVDSSASDFTMETRSQAKKRKANPEMPPGPDDNINLQTNGEIQYVRDEKSPDSVDSAASGVSQNQTTAVETDSGKPNPNPDAESLTEDMEIKLKPSEIRFSQDSIGGRFRDKRPLTRTFAHLLVKNLRVRDLDLIECTKRNEKYYVVSGNRRLLLYKKLEDVGVVRKIPVIFTRIFDEKNFTTWNDGEDIRCRDDMTKCRIGNIIDQWKKGKDAKDIINDWGLRRSLQRRN